MKTIKDLKVKLKADAAAQKARRVELFELKSNRLYMGKVQFDRYINRAKYRHLHIAYCLMRGTPYNAIERVCDTRPNWSTINKHMTEYGYEKEAAEELLRACA